MIVFPVPKCRGCRVGLRLAGFDRGLHGVASRPERMWDATERASVPWYVFIAKYAAAGLIFGDTLA